jgi:ParB family chromosome partitioning protein
MVSKSNDPTPVTAGLEIEAVAPADLLVDVNVRIDLRLDADFIASIREHGVLVPVVAVRTPEGALRVRFGHRRVAAAVELGLAGVPVVVAGDEESDDAAQVERVLGQWAENRHRSGLTTAEEVGVVEQLAAFGVSAAQIARRTRLPRAAVKAALAVAGDELAQAATARYEFLDLIQAATVAEFSDDPEAVKALVAAAKSGQFEHTAQRLRDVREEKRAKEAAARPLREAGVRVIGRPEYGSKITKLGNLTAVAEGPDVGERSPLTPEEHATCPGRAAYLMETWVRGEPEETPVESGSSNGDEDEAGEDDEDGGSVVPLGRYEWRPMYVCTDPTTNGHHHLVVASRSVGRVPLSELSEEDREAARAQRRDVIESNKAWARRRRCGGTGYGCS